MKQMVIALTLSLGLAFAAVAETIEELLLASLEEQGYVIIEEGYTFLGRLRIVAERDNIRREIVVNPGTGEILRDYAEVKPAPLPGTGKGATANLLKQSAPASEGNLVPPQDAGPAPSSPQKAPSEPLVSNWLPWVPASPDAGAGLDVILGEPVLPGETSKE